MSRRLASVVVLLLATSAVAAPTGAAGAAPAGAPGGGDAPPLAVTGFALGSLHSVVVTRDAHALTTVTVAGIGITPSGRGVARPTPDVVKVGRVARRQGLRTELLVNNYSNRRGDFDPAAAHALLSRPARVDRVARLVARHAVDGGWDGVNVDLELVRRSDAGGLVRLVSALQAALPAASTVSIDISAATSVGAYRDRGYALGRLGRAADVIQVMAYDQHGPTWSGPGPVGDLRWQRRALRALLTKVPAERIDLGVAGYGYTWPREGTGHTVTPARARRLAREADVRPVWHASQGEWSVRFPNGTTIWWSDARAYRQRVTLAADLGLHGLAIWRLGSADPL